MPTTALRVCDIQVVASIFHRGAEAEVCFTDRQCVSIPADHPDYDVMLRNAENSIRRQTPVGYFRDETRRLTDLNYTYQVTVRMVHDDDEDSNRLLVGFWEFSAVCYLTREHPDFARIRATLETAKQTGERLIFANHMWPRESETEVWNSILDVRPLNSSPLSAHRNGTT